MSTPPTSFICRLCGLHHTAVPLPRGRTARCIRCSATLARRPWGGTPAGLAYTLTGFILFWPAAVLPFAVVQRGGAAHTATAWDGVVALWEHGLLWLAGWTGLCAFVAPGLLLFALTGAGLAALEPGATRQQRLFGRLGRAMETWAMPEVYVLAVLVALVRVEALADVTLGPGFWCYGALSVVLMLAWRSFEYGPAPAHA